MSAPLLRTTRLELWQPRADDLAGLQALTRDPETWRFLGPDVRGQGMAREAMEAVLAWFDAGHGPRRIACMIERGNLASERLAAALGFAAYDSHRLDDGADVVLYERLRA